MNKKNKAIFLSSLIIGVLTLTLGVTFAVFNFNKTSTNSKLIVGDIYMHYNETNQITIDNAMPSNTYNETNYFEFTIDGKNTTTNKDIWYEIVLSHGDNHETRTTRIRDDLLKFRLVEVIDSNETVLFNNRSYDDLTSQRIWVDTINKNTTIDVVHTYRLYMWISNDTKIGNVNQSYTIDEWNDVYASIKVNVNGDFNKKRVENASEFKELVKEKQTDSCKTYIEEDGITYISGTADCINFNYVWYSGKLWRITAIYPDGTMKMITDDQITTISYGSDVNFYTDNENKSYMYQWLNEDFLDTLYNYENIIVTDSKWNATNSNASSNSESSNKLPETTMVTASVGLLNSYEYYMSYQNTSTSSGYINISYEWWLLNPYNNSLVWYVTSFYGDCSNGNPSYTYGVRPSINLKSGIQLSGGSGAKTDPYTIAGDKEEVTAGTTLLNTRSSGEYVKFNNELYRIVSIENNITKINKNDYIRYTNNKVLIKKFSTSVTYGGGDSDDYWDYYLNNTWYNALDSAFQNMIVESTYYISTVSNGTSYKNAVCTSVSNTVTIKNCEKTTSTWTGKVGLPRYGEMFASLQGSGWRSTMHMWLMNPSSTSSIWIFNCFGDTSNYNPSNTSGGRPSLNLKSNIKIIGGNGTKGDPFEISE